MSTKITNHKSNLSFSQKLNQLNPNQRLSLISIASITLSLSLAFWLTTQMRANQSLKLVNKPQNPHKVVITSDLPVARIDKTFQALVLAVSNQPSSQLHLTLTQLPPGIHSECNQESQPSAQVSCTIYGTPTNSGSHQILATVSDQTTQNQNQEWITLSIQSTNMHTAFKDYFSI